MPVARAYNQLMRKMTNPAPDWHDVLLPDVSYIDENEIVTYMDFDALPERDVNESDDDDDIPKEELIESLGFDPALLWPR